MGHACNVWSHSWGRGAAAPYADLKVAGRPTVMIDPDGKTEIPHKAFRECQYRERHSDSHSF